jgi:hypothetical protein
LAVKCRSDAGEIRKVLEDHPDVRQGVLTELAESHRHEFMTIAAKQVLPDDVIEAIRRAYWKLEMYASEHPDPTGDSPPWELYAAEIGDVLRRLTAEVEQPP